MGSVDEEELFLCDMSTNASRFKQEPCRKLWQRRDFDLVVTDDLLGRETGAEVKPHVPAIISGTMDTLDHIVIVAAFLSKAE